MYHEATLSTRAYYDTLEEMPKVAKVYFPNEKEPKEMTIDEMYRLSDEGWYTIMHTVNWGSCDHWTSVPLRKWVNERFNKTNHYTSNGKADGKHVGYNRQEWSVRLTRDRNYWKSEVWNS